MKIIFANIMSQYRVEFMAFDYPLIACLFRRPKRGTADRSIRRKKRSNALYSGKPLTFWWPRERISEKKVLSQEPFMERL
ncbi:MAG: hypothetical protein DDT21_00504 [Syntrophomonadaceae bacterium]|nr:hypothetical protein [Bacillota bacterium]